MKMFSSFLVTIYFCIFSKEINCKRFDRLARNSKPAEAAYEVVEVEKYADQKCFSICHYELQCVALLIERIADLQFQCSLYDKTIHYLTMTSNPNESVFHSMFFPIFRDCVDHYKSGARQSGLYICL